MLAKWKAAPHELTSKFQNELGEVWIPILTGRRLVMNCNNRLSRSRHHVICAIILTGDGIICWRIHAALGLNQLTHWGRDKMDAISHRTLSNAFSWMKMLEFRLNFHWSVFIRVKSIIFQHCFRWWLGADQATSHYLNQWWLDYRRIYASLGLNELNCTLEIKHHIINMQLHQVPNNSLRPCDAYMRR